MNLPASIQVIISNDLENPLPDVWEACMWPSDRPEIELPDDADDPVIAWSDGHSESPGSIDEDERSRYQAIEAFARRGEVRPLIGMLESIRTPTAGRLIVALKAIDAGTPIPRFAEIIDYGQSRNGIQGVITFQHPPAAA